MLTAEVRISKRILPLPAPFGRCRLASCNPSPLPLKINRDAFHNARDLNFHSWWAEASLQISRIHTQGDTDRFSPSVFVASPFHPETRRWKINRAALHIVGKVSAARIKRPGTR